MNSSLALVLREKGTTIHTVSPEASVREAVSQMNRESVGALLVADAAGLVGIFTERDVLSRVVDKGLDPAKTLVGQVMTRTVLTVKPDTKVEEAMAVMTEKRCRHLPVMEGKKPTGLVSIGDLTRWVVRGQAVLIQDLVDYVQGAYPR